MAAMGSLGVAINRGCSPMHLYEESIDQTKDEILERKKQFMEKQRTKSPFLVGSIEEVNRKISNLDRKLQCYTELVVESRASDASEEARFLEPPSSDIGREIYLRREKELTDVNRFAGIYTMKQTLLPGTSERVKNVNKISMKHSRVQQKKKAGQPKFVELHQYPGYESQELTPLPQGLSAVEMFSKVALGQPKLETKKHYKVEFDHLLYSRMSQAILQDLFWWVFLEKFQNNDKEAQYKMFNRISHNYVKLFFFAKDPVYKETFFKEYPSLLSQAAYSTFCYSFPDSYRQFGEAFKDDLCHTVYQWIVGLKPVPRIWLKWNYDALEPQEIKAREEIMRRKKEHGLASAVIEFPDTSNMYGSHSTLNQTGSASSISTVGRRNRMKNAKNKRIRYSPSESSDGQEKAADTSTSANMLTARNADSPHKASSFRKKTKKQVEEKQDALPMSPIQEFSEDNVAGSKSSELRSYQVLVPQKKKPVKESHPVGRGPEFAKHAFILQGRSPLVAHFLSKHNLVEDSGMNTRVRRTEIEKLPPLDTPTYRDLIRQSYKTVAEVQKKFEDILEKSDKQTTEFYTQQRKMLRACMEKEECLLGKPKEVKRLSDLLLLELNKDPDSVTAGANAALEAALSNQDCS